MTERKLFMGIKLKEIELVNFANLFTGLGVTRLNIDFTKQTNVVCVIIGKNGRGKTSLLSYMTPFSGLGNIDDRTGVKLIIDGEKGYKRIVFVEDSGTEYEIEHHYLPQKDTYTTKSYLKVDGKELNENGNVRSFEQLVYELLGIDSDYLRLVRIGDNVSNLIKAKSTERKVFMGKLLEEIDIYLKYYKKKAKQSSELSAVIGHITDEITKTGINDVDEAERAISYLEEDILRVDSELSKFTDERSRILYEIEIIDFPDDGERTMSKLSAKIDKYEKIIDDLSEDDTSDNVSKEVDELNIKRIKLSADIEGIQFKLDTIITRQDEILNDIDDDKLEIEKEEKSLNLTSMRKHVIELRGMRNDAYETRFDETRFDLSHDELSDFVVFLKNTQMLLNNLYEYGKGPVNEVLKMWRQNSSNIPDFITSCMIKLESEKRPDKMSILDKLIDTYSGKVNNNCSDLGCPYRSLYNDLMSIKDATPVNASYQPKDETFYISMKAVYNGLSDILDDITNKLKPIASKLPRELSDIFLIEEMFSHIGNLEPIYDNTIIDKWMNFSADRERYYNLENECKVQEALLNELEANSKEAYFKRKLEEDEKKFAYITSDKEEMIDNLSDKKEELASLTDKIDGLLKKKEALEEYEGKKKELFDLSEKSIKDRQAHTKLATCNASISELSARSERLKTQLTTTKNALDRYQTLSKDLQKYADKLSLVENIKYATSNRNGLPLFYMEVYFQDTVDIANRLLDIVYDGSIYLCKFEINEDAFRIPYVKNGVEISDASLASQGEKSFFNMAISSALRAQCMEKYNIALYDEVDSVFDDDNRQKTIPVLEEQLAISNINQAFLITHNQMFNQYPTDVINLDNLEASTIPISWD
jgi:DNA repair exonuclease SbcCD ATPase subunit